MEQKTAQLRVRAGPNGAMQITAYGGTGAIFFETPSRAKFLIDTGGFELVNAAEVGPSAGKPAGPSETKPYGPTKKKSSVDDQAGRSTDSQQSNEYGPDTSSSASVEDPASHTLRLPESPKRGRPKK